MPIASDPVIVRTKVKRKKRKKKMEIMSLSLFKLHFPHLQVYYHYIHYSATPSALCFIIPIPRLVPLLPSYSVHTVESHSGPFVSNPNPLSFVLSCPFSLIFSSLPLSLHSHHVIPPTATRSKLTQTREVPGGVYHVSCPPPYRTVELRI